MKMILYLVMAVFVWMIPIQAQVLGSCGSGDTAEAVKPETTKPQTSALTVSPVPLPGQQAIDFQLPAVVGDDIRNIKLSDYNGQWRVVCFFPAAFTFV